MVRSQPISISSSRENICVEDMEDGLDRFPKLGLDQEIDPYLGSPTLSRAWSPLEKVEEVVNNDGNDLTLTEMTVEPHSRGEKVKGSSQVELEDEKEAPSHHHEIGPRLSSSGSSPAAWPLEMSESSTSGLGSEVKELLEENSRLERTVESVISRSCGLESKVEAVLGKHSLLERRFSQNQLKAVHGALDNNAGSSSANNSTSNNSSSEEVSGMKDSLLELLTSCETFQKGFDDMSDKQDLLEVQTKSLKEDTVQFKAESDDLREQFAKLSDKFSSLNLECQVDKGNI